jgi:hypothetical protein
MNRCVSNFDSILKKKMKKILKKMQYIGMESFYVY